MTFVKRGTDIRDLPEGFLRLISRLRCFRVRGWETDSDGPTWPKIDREAAGLVDADVVSSQLVATQDQAFSVHKRHILAIDLDWPAYFVESSTPGHHHLYVDVPGGIPHEKYMRLLEALAEANVIQVGYAKVSKERGHSDLRLPWVAKEPFGADLPEPDPRTAEDVDQALAALTVPPPAPVPPTPSRLRDVLPPMPVTDGRPHSRACGMFCRGHGIACSKDCPTCHGNAEGVL